MRTLSTGSTLALAAVLLSSSLAGFSAPAPQAPQTSQSKQAVDSEDAKWVYNGLIRVNGTGGPAPKHDLTGTWAGPRSGAQASPILDAAMFPASRPRGKSFRDRKSLQKFSPAGTNDPTVRTCDPFGFPRAAIDEIRGVSFATMNDRIVVLYQFQQVWREIWTNGQELPKNVGASVKGAPDPRYYGYSTGHWERRQRARRRYHGSR